MPAAEGVDDGVGRLGADRVFHGGDCARQVEIVGRQRLGRAVFRQRVGRVSTLLMDLGERSERGEILRSGLEDRPQLVLGGVDIADRQQRAPERDPR